jgi:hypothetical protein
MRIVVILAASDEGSQRDDRSAERLETFLTAYYTLQDANVELVLASPEGGYPLALGRGDRKDSTPVLRRFRSDRVAREALADTLSTDQVFAADFDAAFCIGTASAAEQDATATLVATLLACTRPVVIMADAAGAASHAAGQGMLIITGAAGSAEAATHALLAALRPGGGS